MTDGRRLGTLPSVQRWLALLFVVALVPGCLPNLRDYYVVGSDPGRDSGTPPLPDGGPIDAGTGGPCALPHLLIAVENLRDGAGTILRYELPTGGGVRACQPLRARGALMQQPFAVTAATDRFVLVAGREGVQGIDPETDALRFDLPRSGDHPNDAFAIFDPGRGDWVAGVAWSGIGTSSGLRGGIRHLVLYTFEGAERRSWMGSTLGISSSIAVSSSPLGPSTLLVMHPTSWAAAELDPFGQVLATSPPLVGPVGGTVLSSIGAGSGVGVGMIAWGARVDGEERMVTIDEPYTGDLFQVTCGERPCQFQHVAVDPSRRRAVLGLCDVGGRREVVRLDFQNVVCEPLVPEDAIPSTMRMSYLAFAQSR